jgi:hypothetical protein
MKMRGSIVANPIYIYIWGSNIGFATIDPLIFMKVYFSNLHLLIWTQKPLVLFFGKIEGIYIWTWRSILATYTFLFGPKRPHFCCLNKSTLRDKLVILMCNYCYHFSFSSLSRLTVTKKKKKKLSRLTQSLLSFFF